MNVAAVRQLVLKELRQVRRAKRAVFTAVVMPVMFMVFLPVQWLVLFRPAGAGTTELDPPVVRADTQGPPPTACARVRAADGSPLANAFVYFRVGGDYTPAVARTDATGRACAVLPVQLRPGTYQLSAQTPLVRGPMRVLPGRLDVTGPPPSSYVIVRPPAAGDTVSTGFLDIATRFLVPLFLFMAGAIVPVAFAAQTVLLERERRSLDLLLSLPVTVAEVLASKVAFTVLVSLAVLVPLFIVDLVLLVLAGENDPLYLLAATLLLLASVAASALFTLVIALVTRELRAASNTSGLLTLPALTVVGAILFWVPPPVNMLLAAVAMAAAGGLAYWAATGWITFERYLE